MRNRLTRIICFSLAFAAIAGCQTPHHTNVMVFGTNTKLGFDIGSDATGARPQVNLGYKRQEMVWMPLLANSTFEETPPTPASCGGNCLFVAKDGVGEIDTYSVLASFGAEFGGSSGITGAQDASASGSGGLAQFFATGPAARRLAERGGSRLFSIRGSDAEELSKAQDRADYLENEMERIEKALRSNMGSAEYDEAVSGVPAKKAKLQTQVDDILKYVMKKDGTLDPEKWKTLVRSTGLSPFIQGKLLGKTDLEAVKTYLKDHISKVETTEIEALHTQIGDLKDA